LHENRNSNFQTLIFFCILLPPANVTVMCHSRTRGRQCWSWTLHHPTRCRRGRTCAARGRQMLHQQRERGCTNKTQSRYTQQNLIGSKHSGSIPGLQSRSCIMRITMSLQEY